MFSVRHKVSVDVKYHVYLLMSSLALHTRNFIKIPKMLREFMKYPSEIPKMLREFMKYPSEIVI